MLKRMAALIGFDHLYLEDSYLLGFGVNGDAMEFRALFALARGHPLYELPRVGEQHCYRDGLIRVVGIRPLDVHGAARPSLLHDPDGSLDLGSITVSADGDSYRITTEWFDLRFEADSVTASILSHVRYGVVS